MQDFFPTMAMKANPQCNDRHCREQQEEYKVGWLLIIRLSGDESPCVEAIVCVYGFFCRREKQNVQKSRLYRKKRKWCMTTTNGVSHK